MEDEAIAVATIEIAPASHGSVVVDIEIIPDDVHFAFGVVGQRLFP